MCALGTTSQVTFAGTGRCGMFTCCAEPGRGQKTTGSAIGWNGLSGCTAPSWPPEFEPCEICDVDDVVVDDGLADGVGFELDDADGVGDGELEADVDGIGAGAPSVQVTGPTESTTPRIETRLPQRLTGTSIGSCTTFPDSTPPAPVVIATAELPEDDEEPDVEPEPEPEPVPEAEVEVEDVPVLAVPPEDMPLVELEEPAALIAQSVVEAFSAAAAARTEFPQRLTGTSIGSWAVFPDSTPPAPLVIAVAEGADPDSAIEHEVAAAVPDAASTPA